MGAPQTNPVAPGKISSDRLSVDATDLFGAALPEALARADFSNLAVLLRYARDGCWAFALYNYATVREQVVAALKLLLEPLPVYEWTYADHDPYPLSYLDRLSETQRQERAIVFIFDFEKADEKTWKALDYNRELLASHPYGLVFWITPVGRGRAARQAPHFWAQRSGVFDFTIAAPPALEQVRPFVSPEAPIADRADLQRRLRLYLGMLADLAERNDAPPQFLAELHHKAARAAYYLDEVALARTHAEAAHNLAIDQEDRQLQADILKTLGDLALREADLAQARQRYEAALRIYPAIGARLGEAGAYTALGRATDDAQYFERAIQLHEAIRSAYDVAVDKYYFGRSQMKLGNSNRGRALLAEARDIWRSIGLDVYARMAEEAAAGPTE